MKAADTLTYPMHIHAAGMEIYMESIDNNMKYIKTMVWQ